MFIRLFMSFSSVRMIEKCCTCAIFYWDERECFPIVRWRSNASEKIELHSDPCDLSFIPLRGDILQMQLQLILYKILPMPLNFQKDDHVPRTIHCRKTENVCLKYFYFTTLNILFLYLIMGGFISKRLAVSLIRFWKPSMRGISSNKWRDSVCILDHNVFVPRATGNSGFNKISCKYGCGKKDNLDRIAITAIFNSYGCLAISRTWRKSNRSSGPS